MGASDPHLEADERKTYRLALRTKGALIRGAHRLTDLLLGVDPGAVLNDSPVFPETPDPSAALQKATRAIKAEAVGAQGKGLDYAALGSSPAYESFRRYTHSLSNRKPAELGGSRQRTAFWLNLYNALIIDAVIAFRVRDSVREDPGFFRRAAYDVGGMRFSADDIEHGILRGNRRHPLLPFPPFGPDDPRMALVIEQPDARIHFALVCGARSCPPIAFYEGGDLDAQLDLAACNFIHQEGIRYEEETNTLWLSKIFQWYRRDFGGKEGLAAFVSRYAEDPTLKHALTAGGVSIRYQTYDWSVNALA